MREINALAIVGQRNPRLQLPIQILQFIDSFMKGLRHYLRRSALPRYFGTASYITWRIDKAHYYYDTRVWDADWYSRMLFRSVPNTPYYGPGF